MKIAFAGPGLCGKTTAAEYLEATYGGSVKSFARALKRDAYDYGWDGNKDARGRQFLQELGAVVREYNPNYWIEQVELDSRNNIYIDDLRFENEVEILRQHGFIIVYLWPSRLVDPDAEWRQDTSEQFDKSWAHIILASPIGDLPEFRENLDSLYKLIEDGEFDDILDD